jgi:N-acetylglucosaminyl-diphospho-decaprenol L-rhamnosyltransferase
LEAPLLDIVIVTATGGRDLLRACLQSLYRDPLTCGEATIHVVDNASADGTVEMVREQFPTVKLLEVGRNAGFSVANNLVLARTDSPLALLLNPDTEARQGTLDRCVYGILERPQVGMLGCRLVQPDGTFDHAAKRSFPTPLGALAHFAKVGRVLPGGALAQYRATDVPEHGQGEVDAVNGAFMLVRRSAIEQVGLLDEAYWLYMEDLDWCYRFRQAGWKVWYDGSSSFVHVKGGTSKRRGHRSLRANIAFHRGMGRFYRKFYAGRRPLLDGAVYLAIGAKLAISAMRGAVAASGVVGS